MKTDLTYTNKAGISLQNVMDVLADGEPTAKKDIQTALKTDKNIDALLKKLEDASLIEKKKKGNKLFFTLSTIKPVDVEEKIVDGQSTVDPVLEAPVIEEKVEEVIEPVKQKRKVNRAKPQRTKTPKEVEKLNEQTADISKEHQITSLVEIPDEEKIAKDDRGPKTNEVNPEDLDSLKKEMESRLGKEVTAVLHKRKDRVVKERKKTPQEIYETQQLEIKNDEAEYDKENPYRFVLNFFTSTLNGEKATPYFRRRDEYVVKSIYNKFKSLCDSVEEYAISPQNLPFYRVITINEKSMVVKMYHIDMNRIVRGEYTLFKLNQFDNMFLNFKE